MLKSYFLLLSFASTLGLSQLVPSCPPPSDTPPCAGLRTADFENIEASTGLLTSPSTCLESYETLSYDNFSVFSLGNLAGSSSQHLAGFQLSLSAHEIHQIDPNDIFIPRSFDFLCALPAALGIDLGSLTPSVDCTIRVTPLGPSLDVDAEPVNCTYTAGGLLTDLAPASCELPSWGLFVKVISIEVIEPGVLNTLYAFGISSFSYEDQCWMK
ncbi:hypothetical protein G7054_g6778 [Neopestalotiopsis clavispora]|nr:hypothetical protein G7054_g6778 [Neopestalotiopsis clavispora]